MGKLFVNAEVVTPEGILSGGFVRVEDGRITEVGAGSPEASGGEERVDCGGGFLLPGFVDLHCHGGNGFEFTAGRYVPEREVFETNEEVRRKAPFEIAAAHAARGTTTMLMGSCAAPLEELLDVYRGYAAAVSEGGLPCRVEGIYAEGSFLKDPAYAGAQDEEGFLEPSLETFDRMNEAAEGALRVVTVAPEWEGGVYDFIEGLTERGVVAASGHTGARFRQMERAVEAGVRLATHFSNGPMFTTFKPPGGAMEAMIGDERVVLELICDGHHINPRYVMDFVNGRFHRTALITDAMPPVGRPDVKAFVTGGKRGVLSEDGGVLRLEGTEFTLFGSVLTMDRAVANMARWLSGNLPGIYSGRLFDEAPSLGEALVLASRMASGVPAGVLGLSDRGAIEAGKLADLVLMDRGLEVRAVYVGGEEAPA